MLINSIAFIIACLITFFIGYRIYGVSINPLFSTISIFFIAMAIFYSADFINHDLSVTTVIIYIVGYVFFIIGLVCSQFIKNKTIVIGKLKTNDYRETHDGGECEYLIHYKIVKIGFIITIIVFLITLYWIIFHLGITAFLSDIFKSVRDSMSGTGLFTINELLKKSLIIFCPIEINFAQKYQKKKGWCYFFVLLALVVSISFTRVVFLYLLIVDFFAFYFNINPNNKKANIKNKMIIIGIVLFAIVFFNNTQELFNKTMSTVGNLGNYQLSTSQITLLSYFFAPLKSTDMYVRAKLDTLPFVATFRYFYEYILHITTSSYVDVPFVRIPFSFNTALGVYYLYREGGMFWTAIMAFFYGFISDRVYMKYKKMKSADRIASVSFLMLCLLMSIRSYMPMFLEFWIPLITLLIVSKAFQRARLQDNILYLERIEGKNE